MRARTGLYRWSPNGDVQSREGGTEGSRFSSEKLTPYRLRLNAKGCDRKRGVVNTSLRRCSQHAGRTDGRLFVHIWIRRWRRLLNRLVLTTHETADGMGGATKILSES